MANKYASSGVPYGDLVNAGLLGLVIASKRFDPDRGSKFISFATSFVQHEMIRAIRETRFPCRVPLNLNAIVNKIRRGEGDEDSPEFASILPLLRTPERENFTGFEGGFEDTLVARLSVSHALSCLDLRTRKLIIRYAGIDCMPLGISELALEFNLSKQRVRSLISQGFVNMRRVLEKHKEVFETSPALK
jgi:RNA polymerase sigma factor (sigma-70 family)